MKIKYYFTDRSGNKRIIEDTENDINNITENRDYIMATYDTNNVYVLIDMEKEDVNEAS